MSVVSCQRNPAKELSFPETVALTSRTMPIKEGFMRYPFRICMNDSNIYVMDLHGTEYYCHLFSYPDMEYRQSFGKKGEAPDELLDAETIRLENDGALWILDANKKKLVQFHRENPDSAQREINLSETLVRTLDFDRYNDSLFVVPDYTGLHRFVFVNLKGQPVESRGEIPVEKKDGEVPGIILAQAWRSFLDYNPEHGLLAMVTQLGDVLEIYDLKNDTLVAVKYGKSGQPRFEVSSGYAVPTGIMGYSGVQIGKKHIYALFWGYTFDELKKGKVKTEGGNQIRLFDLMGNPVRTYTLDRYLTGFYVNEKTNTIIGLDVNSDQPLVSYELAVN